MEIMELGRAGSLRLSNSNIWRGDDDIFTKSSRNEDDDLEALKWAALEKLPTYSRLHKGLFNMPQGGHMEVDIQNLGPQQRKELLERLVRFAEKDLEIFYLKLRDRIHRVGIELPTIQVRYNHLSVEAETYVGNRGTPTIFNFIINTLEEFANYLHILPSRKKPLSILHDVSGIIKPGRLTLLLGPPSSGKTTLLLALSGKLGSDVKVLGNVTYNGHEMDECAPKNSCLYQSA